MKEIDAAFREYLTNHSTATLEEMVQWIEGERADLVATYAHDLTHRALVNDARKVVNEACRASDTEQIEMENMLVEIVRSLPGLPRCISVPNESGAMTYVHWAHATRDMIRADIETEKAQIEGWKTRIRIKSGLIKWMNRLGVPQNQSLSQWMENNQT